MKKDLFKIVLISTCVSLVAFFNSTPASGKNFTVVIDAGHGGHDPGAVGKISKEKTINLNVALLFGKMIQNNCDDVKVVYTRKTDVFIPLDKRATIANNAKADLFISIHTNAVAKGNTAKGAETFTLGLARSEANLEIAKRENSVILIEDDYKKKYAGFNPNSSESYIMFEFIQDKHMEQSVKLAKLVQGQFRNHAQRVDRGVHQAGFLVLRATTMPSVLIELGYISNSDEERFLNTKEGTEKLSEGIFRAFLKYKAEHEKPLENGKTDILADAKTQDIIEKESERPDTPAVESKEQMLAANTSKASKSVIRISESAATNKPIFKIQILTASKVLSKQDKQFKGLSPVDYYKENGIYKYTYEESTDYNKILRTKRSIAPKFKDAFIISFRNGEKTDVQKAIAEFKRGRKN